MVQSSKGISLRPPTASKSSRGAAIGPRRTGRRRHGLKTRDTIAALCHGFPTRASDVDRSKTFSDFRLVLPAVQRDAADALGGLELGEQLAAAGRVAQRQAVGQVLPLVVEGALAGQLRLERVPLQDWLQGAEHVPVALPLERDDDVVLLAAAEVGEPQVEEDQA